MKNLLDEEKTISREAKVRKNQKNGKLTFESADAIISDKDTSISQRNEDATKYMCRTMGVSTAIINHVLFCHQEESNWPFGTDNEVMKKFDKILGTDRYNEALDIMRKKRSNYETTIKEKSW